MRGKRWHQQSIRTLQPHFPRLARLIRLPLLSLSCLAYLAGRHHDCQLWSASGVRSHKGGGTWRAAAVHP